MKKITDPIIIGYETCPELSRQEIRSRLKKQRLKFVMAMRGEGLRRGVLRSMCCLGPSTGISDIDTLRAFQIGHHAGRIFALLEAREAIE